MSHLNSNAIFSFTLVKDVGLPQHWFPPPVSARVPAVCKAVTPCIHLQVSSIGRSLPCAHPSPMDPRRVINFQSRFYAGITVYGLLSKYKRKLCSLKKIRKIQGAFETMYNNPLDFPGYFKSLLFFDVILNVL